MQAWPLKDGAADSVTAVVHKPNAAGRLGIDGVAAAATATGSATAGG